MSNHDTELTENVLDGCPTGSGCDSIACRMANEIRRRRDDPRPSREAIVSAFMDGAGYFHDHSEIDDDGRVVLGCGANVERAAEQRQ